ncbi:MAG: DUF4440 domain-containing protein [Chitinophagaceae bacterium]|nr:DUF4440 domain-containing protein [Chitinophagaceae bacterium]
MIKNFDRTDPDDADEYFLEAVRNGDVKTAMTCFDKEGVYIGKDSKPISGMDNIEKVITELCKMKPDIKVYEHQMSPVGSDMMYWLDKWTMTAAAGADGKPMKMKGASANMMRKNADGQWLWLVDNPFALPFFDGQEKK